MGAVWRGRPRPRFGGIDSKRAIICRITLEPAKIGTSLRPGSYQHSAMYYRTPPRRNRLLRRMGIVVAILYAAGIIFGGMWLGEVATHPGRRPITSAGEAQVRVYAIENRVDFRDASITASDGVALRGWFLRPEQANGSTVKSR